MIETHQIIVLNSLKYADDKIIVNALSRSAGRVSLLVRVSHGGRRNSEVRHTLFQPMSMLEVQWESTSRTTIFKPKSARATVPLLSIQSNPIKATIALFLAEFLGYVTRSNFDGGLLFDYIAYALRWLDTADHAYTNFHIVFLLRLARFFGIAPESGHIRDKDLSSTPLPYFDLQEGEYRATQPIHSYYIYAREAALIPTLMRLNFATMHRFKATGAERSRILSLIITFYRLQLPDIPELKSLEVLQEVFQRPLPPPSPIGREPRSF